jgi:hypothetical protein
VTPPTPSRRWLRPLALLLALGLTAAACGDADDAPADGTTATTVAAGTDDDDTDDDGTGTTTDGEEAAAGDLGQCPNPIVFQTDWFPEPEHGALYNLTAGQGEIDVRSGRFTGPLAADPSIDVEIRAGGPYVGNQQSIALLGTDADIFLSYINTDEAVQNYDQFPTTAVVAPLDINPQIIMWDPETYPISSWDEVRDTGAVFAYFAGAAYTEYLVDAGLLDADQLDPSYDGSPARFIAQDGAIMQQGFATQEPYKYENDFEEWGRPVDFLLIHDSGYEIYQGPLAILDERLDDAARTCLTALVPIIQQSIVDFQADPGPTNELLLRIVEDLDSFWVLTEGGVENTVQQMEDLDIVGNGADDTVGNFDLDRVEEVLEILRERVPSIQVPEGITAEDLVTNEFIDPSIGF